MKNQYFGDVNDYRKYGLLRSVQSVSSLNLLVAWMLTPDDGGPDGGFRSYLSQPGRWKRFDPELYAGLASLLQSARHPRVSFLEDTDLLPRSSFFSEEVPENHSERNRWFSSLLRASSSVDVVFLDPDNGIEIPSKPAGRKSSSKYVLWSELAQLWAAGCSLVIYQHFPRKPRDVFVADLISKLRMLTSAPFIEAFRTPHVLFLVAAQLRHEQALRAGAAAAATAWRGEIGGGG